MAKQLADKIATKLHINKKSSDSDSDDDKKEVAILSGITEKEIDSFNCALKDKCILGTPKSAAKGTKKMEYKSRQWHEKCFCCCVCKTTLTSTPFIPHDDDMYCTPCHTDKFCKRCVKCDKHVTGSGVQYKDESWHRECFTCTGCSKELAGVSFTSHEDKPYCSDCFAEKFAKRCAKCTKPITGAGGTRFITFEERHWHNDCFVCSKCETSLGGKGFAKDGDNVLCPECAKKK